MVKNRKRHHAELRSTRAGYTTTGCRHDPMTLVRTVVASIRAPVWSTMQMEGMREWRRWIASWAGPKAGPEPLSELVTVFGKIFFLGKLHVAEDKFEVGLHEQMKWVGMMTEEDRQGGRVTISLEPDNVHQLKGRNRHRRGMLGTLLHECVHAFLALYACDDRSCDLAQGQGGHGQAWFHLAPHVEAVAHRYLGRIGDVGVWCSMISHGLSDYVPTVSDWQEMLGKLTVEDLAGLAGAGFCLRNAQFAQLLKRSRERHYPEVEEVMRETIERWIVEMARRRTRRNKGLLTSRERNDLEALQKRLKWQCRDCKAGHDLYDLFAERHFIPGPQVRDKSWLELQSAKLQHGRILSEGSETSVGKRPKVVLD